MQNGVFLANDKKDEFKEVERQLAFADRILLNKKDLVSEDEVERLKHLISNINPMAPIVPTERSQIDLNTVLNINAFHDENYFQKSALQNQENHSCSTENCSDSSHTYTSHVKAITVTAKGTINRNKFNIWLASILWEEDEDQNEKQTEENQTNQNPKNEINNINVQSKIEGLETPRIYRFKGLLAFDDSCQQHILQGVHSLFEVDETQKKWDFPENRILFIGRSIEQLDLHTEFSKLVNESKV